MYNSFFVDATKEQILSLFSGNETITGSDDMWLGRANYLLSSVLPALIDLRDSEYLELDSSVIKNHLSIERIIDLSNDREGVKPESARLLKEYLFSLPCYVERKVHNESLDEKSVEMHNYIKAILLGILEQTNELIESFYMHGNSLLQKNKK